MWKYVLVSRLRNTVCVCVCGSWGNDRSCKGTQSFDADFSLYLSVMINDKRHISRAAPQRRLEKTEGQTIWLAFRSCGELIRIPVDLRQKAKELFSGIIPEFNEVGWRVWRWGLSSSVPNVLSWRSKWLPKWPVCVVNFFFFALSVQKNTWAIPWSAI